MILVVGDIHRRFDYLNSLINKKQPSIVLQVGDFGYWPNLGTRTELKNGDTIVYFCEGNHEDHESLKSLKNNEIEKNVFHMKRGSTIDLPDGRTILFIGGAHSFDWEFRTPGLDWFPELELVTESDLENLPDKKIDIVISHTAPEEFYMSFSPKEDPSRESLSYILKKYKPKLWFFGHFHVYSAGFDSGCKWTALAHIESYFRNWAWLDSARTK